MSSVLIESINIQGIPLLTFCQPQAAQQPPVFFFHGFGERKEKYVQAGYLMAESGLFCIIPDAPKHGQRLAAPLDALDGPGFSTVYPRGTGFDIFFLMFEIVLQTVQELEILLDYFAADPRADASRAGAAGFSMGGFASYLAAPHSRIAAAAPAGAYPALSRRWADLVLEAAAYPQWTQAIDSLREENERRAAWFASFDPYERMKEGHTRPLLMINGELDTHAPKAYTRPLFAALRPRYEALGTSDRLRLHIVDETGHTLTEGIIEETAAWFRRWLIEEDL